MRQLVLTSIVLLGTAAYSQDSVVAYNGATRENEIPVYQLNDVIVSNDIIMLGNPDAKSKKGRAINSEGRTAYYFENAGKEEGLFLNTVLFKVKKVKYKTEARIRLYKKKDFIQDTYHPETSVKNSYASFVPEDQIPTSDITVFLEPGQKGVIEVDLSRYDIAMPEDGLFVSLEGTGYFDADGNAIEGLAAKDMTWIDFHPAADDNFCEWTHTQGSDSHFWMNVNKWLRNDYEFAFAMKVPKNVLKVPNFGLKLVRR